MTTRRRVICLAAMAWALLGGGLLSCQPVARAEEVPLVPAACSPEGTWIMTIHTPWGPQIQTLTVTARTNTMDTEYTAVLEVGERGKMLMNLSPEADRQSRFVGLVKKAGDDAWQMTVLGYGLKQGVAGTEMKYLSVISSGNIQCTGLDVMAARINLATFLARQDADHNGLPDPNERPVVCMPLDASFQRVDLIRLCEPVPVTEPIYVDVGDEFTVSLESNPTTGFGWTRVGALPYWLEQTDYQFRPLPSAPGTTGSGGFEEWTYKARAAASTVLIYEYRQSWDSDSPPARTHSVLVIAEEPVTGQ